MAPAAAVPRMHTQWHGSCVTSSGTHMEEHISGSISPRPGRTEQPGSWTTLSGVPTAQPSALHHSECGQSATLDVCGGMWLHQTMLWTRAERPRSCMQRLTVSRM